jgi:hypothetical protein
VPADFPIIVIGTLRYRKEIPMAEESITLALSKADAEVLLGVLSSERYNTEAEAVCDAVRRQLDEKLAELR